MIKFETRRWYLIKEMVSYLRHLLRHNANIATEDNIEKMQYTILRSTHIIEKGLSLRTPRKAFGKQKILALLTQIDLYAKKYLSQSSDFILYPLSVVAHYTEYETSIGADVSEVDSLLRKIISQHSITLPPQIATGTQVVSKDSITSQAQGNFEQLLTSRHSIRYFSKENISTNLINKALQLAQLTPSACNRQGWRVHIYQGEQATQLLRWQGGARGFEDEPTMAILVSANSRAFLKYEPFQAYVDGGLYAMNLINALHYVGLGTIPLSCGFGYRKLADLYKNFDLPQNERPITIIGVGQLETEFKVAISARKDINQTTTWHK